MSSTVSCILSNLLKVAKINYLWLLFRPPNAAFRRHNEIIRLKQSSTVWSEWVCFTASVSLFREWLESEEVNIQGLIMLFIIQCRPNPCPTAPSLTFTKHTYKAVPSMPMTPHGKYWIIFTWELLASWHAGWMNFFHPSLLDIAYLLTHIWSHERMSWEFPFRYMSILDRLVESYSSIKWKLSLIAIGKVHLIYDWGWRLERWNKLCHYFTISK